MLVDLKRDGGGTKGLAIVGDAGDKTRRNVPAPMIGGHDDIQNLEVRPREPATREADDPSLVVRHPPAAPRLGEFGCEHRTGPGGVGASLVCRGIEGDNSVEVCGQHGTQLQMATSKRLVHARNPDRRACLESEASALALLRIRKPRIHR